MRRLLAGFALVLLATTAACATTSNTQRLQAARTTDDENGGGDSSGGGSPFGLFPGGGGETNPGESDTPDTLPDGSVPGMPDETPDPGLETDPSSDGGDPGTGTGIPESPLNPPPNPSSPYCAQASKSFATMYEAFNGLSGSSGGMPDLSKLGPAFRKVADSFYALAKVSPADIKPSVTALANTFKAISENPTAFMNTSQEFSRQLSTVLDYSTKMCGASVMPST